MKPFREREISKIQGHIPNSKNFGLFKTEKIMREGPGNNNNNNICH